MKALKQLQYIIEKEILDEKDKKYFLNSVSNLNEDRQKAIIDLVSKMESAGFKNNFLSAHSEITENIPQFARQTVFKELHKIIRNIDSNLSYAEAVNEKEDWDYLVEKFRTHFSQTEAEAFLRVYTQGIVAQFGDFFENGNPRSQEDNLNWALMETKDDGTLTGRIIQGFWENDFVEDDYDWENE